MPDGIDYTDLSMPVAVAMTLALGTHGRCTTAFENAPASAPDAPPTMAPDANRDDSDSQAGSSLGTRAGGGFDRCG
jgi:hypothetical protein